ncbi:MAG: DMT family transporter [Anaerolineales bacterium]|nr:DMT family transporter [Anaerolineales bacterium]
MVNFGRKYLAELMLLLTAVVWGFAFVPQRVAMETMGPLAFNAVRFSLGGVILLPLLWVSRRKQSGEVRSKAAGRSVVLGGVLSGAALFLAAATQQIGMVYTTAGKAGFITGMYVILVPVLGIFLGKKMTGAVWVAGVLSVAGLYMLSVQGRESINQGDIWVLISAFFWAAQIHIIDQYARRIPALMLAVLQFLSCALLSGLAALVFEQQPIYWTGMGIVSVLYVGVFSTALAFSLQVYAQQISQAGPAAVVMNLEGVFAAIAGWLLLNEALPPRGILGGILMFAGMFIVVWEPKKTELPGNIKERG